MTVVSPVLPWLPPSYAAAAEEEALGNHGGVHSVSLLMMGLFGGQPQLNMFEGWGTVKG